VLVERGTPAPKSEGELAGAHFITIPARAVANPDELAKLRTLGLADRVVATGGASVYPEIHVGHRSGKIQKIGNAGSVNLETVGTLAPDLLVIFSWMGVTRHCVYEMRHGFPTEIDWVIH
jgi:ABC-type Fe3+-hydroxamate transport system substrate-binding protein